uniref:MHC class I-like antigen recognition-like domain-containing protein n=1 Tax=Serinus canaria TaxID=9135 RepID=A0A8C9NKD7_SERCA
PAPRRDWLILPSLLLLAADWWERVLHSLRYLAVAVSEPSPGVPQFLATGYLDGIPFTRYDSERGRAEPLTQWMKDGVKPEDWERGTQIAVGTQQVFARGLETLRERYNQSRGEWGDLAKMGIHGVRMGDLLDWAGIHGAGMGSVELGRDLWGWNGICGVGKGSVGLG